MVGACLEKTECLTKRAGGGQEIFPHADRSARFSWPTCGKTLRIDVRFLSAGTTLFRGLAPADRFPSIGTAPFRNAEHFSTVVTTTCCVTVCVRNRAL